MNSFRRCVPTLHRLLAVLLLLHLVVILALAASSRLHRWVHPDADNDADCAIVLFQHGSIDQPTAAGPLAAIQLDAQPAPALAVFQAAWVPSIFAESRVFEHAPPSVA